MGLIPENEVAAQAGVRLDSKTNGAVTDEYLQTSVPGVFACGNSRKVLDLADFVTVQGLTAGRNAAAFLLGRPQEPMPPETSNAMAKGLPQPGTITCILCPKGCRIRTVADGKVTGNGCPKGEEYALQEQKSPRRVLTTTLKRADGSLLPVKTSQAVPKEHLLDYMDRLRKITLPATSLPCGTVVLRDPFGIGVDVVTAQ